jgi:predicted enzyme related to lactoylglutathione lyase
MTPLGIVWWEVESPDPEAFQRFHGVLWGWDFQPAFAGTELGADYWVILAGGRGIGGTVERARTELGGDDRWFATVLDPTGVSIGLWTENPLAGGAG